MRTEEYPDEIKDIKSELFQARKQLAEAQAAAAVMRQRLEELLEVHSFIDNDEHHQTRATQAALDPTSGTAFLARMAEAEWLLSHKAAQAAKWWGEPTCATLEYLKRCDAFLKGEGVKA